MSPEGHSRPGGLPLARVSPALLLLLLPLAGCLAPAPAPVEPAAAPQATGGALHVLAGAVEPEGLEAMAFDLLGAISRGGPGFAAAEPSVWAHLDGTLYAAAPGCDRDRLDPAEYQPLPPGSARRCAHGLVFRSDDHGATWAKLNQGADGHLAEDEDSFANGDNEVTVDAAGVVYASNLGRGIQVLRSGDRGATWDYVGNVTPPDHWADRQWMAASAPGHLVVAWMGGDNQAEGGQRAVAVNSTFDGGATWTGTTYLGEAIGWLGPVAFAPDGLTAYVPFTQGLHTPPLPGDPTGLTSLASFYGPAEYEVLVGRTLDGGRTWEVLDTGARVQRAANSGQWSGVLMAPALDVTGDGTVVVAWSEDVPDPTGMLTTTGAVVKVVASRDQGATWTGAERVSEAPTAIMPWVTGGAGDRFALTYYASSIPLDSDLAGDWDVLAALVDGAGGALEVATSVLAEGIHQGGLCARGGGCGATDRTLLDFFEADVLPDGRLVVVYPADPLAGGKYTELRFAVQSGGSLLLARPGA